MSGKYCFCTKTDIAEMPEFFAFMRVGKVHFEHWQLDGFDRVQYCDRGVGEATGVEQHRLRTDGARLMQPVD